MEVLVTTPSGGTVTADTSPVQNVSHETKREPMRLTSHDLDSDMGAYIFDRLHAARPDSFHAGNWRAKLGGLLSQNSVYFCHYEGAIGLAQTQFSFMDARSAVKADFLIHAPDAPEQDGYEILKSMRRWAKGMGAEFRFPDIDLCDIPQSRMKAFFKAEQRVELVSFGRV